MSQDHTEEAPDNELILEGADLRDDSLQRVHYTMEVLKKRLRMISRRTNDLKMMRLNHTSLTAYAGGDKIAETHPTVHLINIELRHVYLRYVIPPQEACDAVRDGISKTIEALEHEYDVVAGLLRRAENLYQVMPSKPTPSEKTDG